MSALAVTADSLVVRFDALTAVDEVSLEIARGEVFGLLGPNGAGKTTTLFFASSALYPLASMPGWLKAVAHVNPLTYEVEGLRSFLLGGGHPLLDLLVCLGWLGVFATAATAAYPRALL